MCRDEIIIRERRITTNDPIDFLRLTGRKTFMRIEAPRATHETLSTKDFVDPCDTAGERVSHVEHCRIRIRQRRSVSKQVRRYLIGFTRGSRLVEQLDRPPRPHGPLA